MQPCFGVQHRTGVAQAEYVMGWHRIATAAHTVNSNSPYDQDKLSCSDKCGINKRKRSWAYEAGHKRNCKLGTSVKKRLGKSLY